MCDRRPFLWYVQPSLELLHAPLARSLAEYRYQSLSGSRVNAQVFGYESAMFAWTAAYLSRPFGFCDGKGGYKNSLEQHVR